MGGRVALANRRIETTTDNGPVENHDGANRHLTETLGSARQRHRFAHEKFVAETKCGFVAHAVSQGKLLFISRRKTGFIIKNVARKMVIGRAASIAPPGLCP